MISNINKTSISKFGGRHSADTANSAPTWSGSAQSTCNGYFSDYTGLTRDIKLIVTYFTPGIKSISGAEKVAVKTASGVAVASIKRIIGLA